LFPKKLLIFSKIFIKAMANWFRKIWAKPDLEDSNLDSSKGNIPQAEEDIIPAGT
jgi:hypothetical protein